MSVGSEVTARVVADPAAFRVVEALAAREGEVYAVGGLVRDVALGETPNDVDLMVRCLTRDQVREALEKLPGRVSEVGKSFGIIEYRCRDGCVQVSLPRQDRSVGVTHRDVSVTIDPEMSVEEDLERRDYTINAVAVRIPNGTVHDPLGGLDDARKRVVRAVNMEVLADDPLRVLRGIVLVAKRPGMWMNQQTCSMLYRSRKSVNNLPTDRIHDELDKLVGSRDPVYGIELAKHVEVLDEILPEVAATCGYDQRNPHHQRDLWFHTLHALDVVVGLTDDKDVRLATWLHDVGKPRSAWVDPETGSNHYYEMRTDDGAVLGADHERLGAQMTHDIMTRLRFSTQRTNRVSSLVRYHMFAPFNTHRGARRFLARVGDHADDLITIRRGDSAERTPIEEVDLLQRLVNEVRAAESAFTVRDLAINGHDLIDLGVPSGTERGEILRALLKRVVDDPDMNDRDVLRSLVESGRVA